MYTPELIKIIENQLYNDLEVMAILVSHFLDENKCDEINLIISKRVQKLIKNIDLQNTLDVINLNISLS